jgi:putative nucleotidyltransferase with HDIG domain
MSDLQASVEGLLRGVAAKRPLVECHARRVSTYAVRLAVHYGLGADLIEDIRVGALLHDIGKLLVPGRILGKPGRLTDREWVELRTHPDKGLELLERTGLTPAMRDIVLHHHERFDGRGYPDGLSGGQIAWPVRLVSIMDSFDALTSSREYREPLSSEAARALIAREAGTRFCPWVVAGFLSLPLGLLQPGVASPPPDCYCHDWRHQGPAVHASPSFAASPN